MDAESWVEQYAEFAVSARQVDADLSADFDPDLITQTLGIEPARTRRRGELGSHGEPRLFSTWSWLTPRRIEFSSEAVLIELLNHVEPKADALTVAANRYDVEYFVCLVIEMHGFVETGSEGKPDFLVATPAVVFQPATLARLSALNLGLTFDQYVYADAPGLDRN